jgi:anti-sigma regulatory factor (Ser/Thr protein kinase)
LRVAEWEPDDDDDIVIPALPASPPQFLPVPSAWWETPAVTSRQLSPVPEEARTARQFVRELLTRWELGYLSDDAEMIIAELVGNAVRHGLRTAPPVISLGKETPELRLCLLRRMGEVMLAVTDPSNEAPTPKAAGADGESGRGLQIVGALSHIWGWSPIEGNGKAVWAVLKSALASGKCPLRTQSRGTPSPVASLRGPRSIARGEAQPAALKNVKASQYAKIKHAPRVRILHVLQSLHANRRASGHEKSPLALQPRFVTSGPALLPRPRAFAHQRPVITPGSPLMPCPPLSKDPRARKDAGRAAGKPRETGTGQAALTKYCCRQRQHARIMIAEKCVMFNRHLINGPARNGAPIAHRGGCPGEATSRSG